MREGCVTLILLHSLWEVWQNTIHTQWWQWENLKWEILEVFPSFQLFGQHLKLGLQVNPQGPQGLKMQAKSKGRNYHKVTLSALQDTVKYLSRRVRTQPQVPKMKEVTKKIERLWLRFWYHEWHLIELTLTPRWCSSLKSTSPHLLNPWEPQYTGREMSSKSCHVFHLVSLGKARVCFRGTKLPKADGQRQKRRFDLQRISSSSEFYVSQVVCAAVAAKLY